MSASSALELRDRPVWPDVGVEYYYRGGFSSVAGNSAWGIPGLGLGVVTWTGPPTADFDIVIGTKFTVPKGVSISLVPPTGAGGYDETTRCSNTSSRCTLGQSIGSPTEVQFLAPNNGAVLVAGDQFFVNVVLTGAIDPTKVGFVASWSPVPIPPTLLLLAPGLLGLVGMRKRFKG